MFFFNSITVSSIEKQTKTRAKWPLIETASNTNSTSTANNSTSSTPLPALAISSGTMSSVDKDETNNSSLLGDVDGISCGGVIANVLAATTNGSSDSPIAGSLSNINNRHRAEKKITAKVSEIY